MRLREEPSRPPRLRTLGHGTFGQGADGPRPRSPTTAWLLGAWVACAACAGLLVPCSALGDFFEPVRISAGENTVGRFDAGLDFFENLTIAYESQDGIFLAIRVGGTVIEDPVGPGADPHLGFGPVSAFVAYSGPAPQGSADREILLTHKTGAEWSSLERFSSMAGSDRFPCLQIWENRLPVVAWENQPETSSPGVWLRREDQPALKVAEGEKPEIVLDRAGRVHLFFLRGGDIYYAREPSSIEPGVFTTPENLTRTPASEESRPRAAIAPDQTIYLSFSRDGSVLLYSNASGKFGAPVLVAEGGAANPCVTVSQNGALALAFEKNGDIQLALGSTLPLPPPVPVLESPEQESDPVAVLDSLASITVVFRRGGALYYVTDADVPQAKFTADPVKGEAPLRVQFIDLSTGSILRWQWEFGDGGTSGDPNPEHLYEKSGNFVVSLRVSGPGGESPIVDRVGITVMDPSNQIRIAGVRVYPGQKGVYVPILATHDKAAQGFTIAAVYDPHILDIRSVDFGASNLAFLQPELFAVDISKDPLDAYVTAGILFDMVAPFDGRVMPPGVDSRIANIILNVSPNALPGSSTRIELRNQLGQPPLNNIVTVEGFTVMPLLREGGLVTIEHLTFPPPRFFLRGDTDGNGVVNLTDVIVTLTYLFRGGSEPDCHDAADANDSGVIDISDAIFTLSFLFSGGIYLPPPCPDPGLDPTDDGLPLCLLR